MVSGFFLDFKQLKDYFNEKILKCIHSNIFSAGETHSGQKLIFYQTNKKQKENMIKYQSAGIACIILAVLFVITGCSDSGVSHKPADTKRETVSLREKAFRMNERLGRGVNLSSSGRLNIREEDFQAIKDAGVNSIRLPVRW